MVDFRVNKKVDTSLSENAYIPTGALVTKASPTSILENYDTDEKCLAAGLVPCDGRALNATTYNSYQELYDIIGNLYGGTNQNDFEVPDLRTSRRYIYGRANASSGIYTPSFSNNSSNLVTHSHSVNAVSTETLLTNSTSGTHTHTVGYTMADANAGHSHFWAANLPGLVATNAIGTNLTKADGTGTAAGAGHGHNTGAFYAATNSGESNILHGHTGSATSSGYTEPTHTHSFISSNASTPLSSGIDIPYINVLYFIKS
jgi:microcystin-dependent protein